MNDHQFASDWDDSNKSSTSTSNTQGKCSANYEEEEEESSPSSDDETIAKEAPVSSLETRKRGTVANVNTSPTLSMFGAPEDNIATSQRTYFEATNLLDDESKGSTSFNRPTRNRHELKHVLIPPGASKASVFRKLQVIKNAISSSDYANDESSNEKIVERVLGMTDKNFNDAFFNCAV